MRLPEFPGMKTRRKTISYSWLNFNLIDTVMKTTLSYLLHSSFYEEAAGAAAGAPPKPPAGRGAPPAPKPPGRGPPGPPSPGFLSSGRGLNPNRGGGVRILRSSRDRFLTTFEWMAQLERKVDIHV